MSDSSNSRRIILTPAEVERWRSECAEIDAQIESLGKKKVGLLEKLRAAEILAPSLFVGSQPDDGSATAPGAVKRRKGRITWTSLIEEEVRNSEEGLPQKSLLTDMRSGAYGDRLKSSESGYYNAIGKLLLRKTLMKYGDHLFTPAQYDGYMKKLKAGQVEDYSKAAVFGSAASASIVSFVKENPGKTSIDAIRAARRANKEGRPPSSTSLYNTIARLVDQGHIVKKEGLLFPPDFLAADNEQGLFKPRLVNS